MKIDNSFYMPPTEGSNEDFRWDCGVLSRVLYNLAGVAIALMTGLKCE